MTIIRKWSGNGLTARPLTTSTAGTGDDAPSVIIGSGQTVVASGSRSPQIQLAQPAGTPCAVQWTFPSQAQGAFRLYWTSPSGPAANSFPVVRLRNGNAGYAMTLNLMVTGNMRLMRSGGVEVDDTGGGGIQWNTRYRVEGIINHGAGNIEVRFYLGEATTPVQILTATGQNIETAHDRLILGNENTAPQVGTMTYDDLAIADNAAFIGSASVSSAASFSGTGTLGAVISTAPRQAAAFSGSGVLVAGGGTQGNLVRNWSGTGLVPGPLTTSSAGAADDPPSSLIGGGQTIAANGTRGPHIVFTQPDGLASGAVWSFPSQSQGAFRFYWVSPTVWPSAPVTIGRLRLSGSPVLSLSVTPEGRMRLLNGSGSEIATTADNAVPRSTRLRVGGIITQGSGAVGSVEVRVYLGESLIPEFTLAAASVNIGTAHTELLIGNPATTPQVAAMTYDDIAVTSTPAFIGPAVAYGSFALSGTGSLNVAGSGTVPTPGIIRKWSGDGLAAGALTSASAGEGDTAPTVLLGAGQTISNTGARAPQIRLNKVNETAALGVAWTFTPQSQGAFRFYWTPPGTAPTSDIQIAKVKAGGTSILTLNLMTSGNFRLFRPGGVIIASTGNGGMEFNASTVYRIEGTLVHNGAAGEVIVKVFVGESTTPLHTLTATADVGSAHDTFQIGTDAAAGPINDSSYDDILVGSNAVFLGPYQQGTSADPPVVSAGADVTEAQAGEEVTLTGTATASLGRSISSLTWSQKDGPPVVLVGNAGGVGSVTIGDQSVTLSDPDPSNRVTENSGLVASQQFGSGNNPILYGHNDSGGLPEVYAFDVHSDTPLLGAYTLQGATNGDWEDIAVGPGPDATKSYIYVGNIGSAGGTKRIYRFAEPAIAHGQALNEVTIPQTGDAPPEEPEEPEEPTGTNPAVTSVSASPTNLFDPDSGDGSPTFYTISGLVVSKNPAGDRILWGLNDNGAGSTGGGDPAIHAFTDTGSQRRILASYTLGGTFNGAGGDWEDMSTGPGPVPGQRYLYIGNFGAQGASDTNLKIYRVAEPAVTAGQSKVTATIPASEVDTFTFSRPDDTRDCEAFICDPVTGDLFYFEKRSYSTSAPKPYMSRVYRCPASQLGAGSRNITWTLVATIVGSTVDQTNTASLVSADISEDGAAIAVATYQGLWVYNRAVGQTVAQALNGTPVYRNLSGWGTETLAFDRGVRPARLYGMTEGTNTTLKYLTATWTAPAGAQRRAGATATGGYDVFTFTGGPEPDCESMFVDPRTGDLFLISKRSNLATRPVTSQVWRIPRSQMPSGNRDVVPELVAEIETNRASTNNGTATAADISADGRWVVVCNYQEIFMWERGDTQSIGAMFTDSPVAPYYQSYIPTATQSTSWGSESIAFAPGLNPGRLYTLGESVGTSAIKYVPLTIESDPGAVTFRGPWVMGPRNVVLELSALDSAGAVGTDDLTVSIIGHPLWYLLPDGRWVPLRSPIDTNEPEPDVEPTVALSTVEADTSAVLSWTVTPGTSGTVDGVYAGHLGGPGLNPWESDFRPGLEGTQNFGRLTNGTTYTLYLDVVVNGTRAKRVTTTVTPTGGVVLPTANLVATPANGGATLAWTITPGSAAVDGAYAGHQGPTPAPFEGPFRAGVSGSQSFSGLINGSTYNLYVDAVVGSARVRRFTTSVTPVATTLPTVSVTAVPGDKTVTLSWTIAANGNTVQGAYVGHTGPAPFESPLRAGLSGTQVVSALTNGTNYTFYVDVVVGGARVTRRTVTATPIATPTGTRRHYGVYNGDWADDETLGAFGRYPDAASGYIQGGYQGWNQTNANTRADRGISGFYTITSKIFPTRIYDLATPGAAGSAQRTKHNEAIAWVEGFADRCNIAANRNPNNQTVYATLDHEHDVKKVQAILTGQSADPAVYGKALTHFIQIFRQRAPRVRTGYWYGGFQSAHIQIVWANIGRGLDGQMIPGFTMDYACMDPYVNEPTWDSIRGNIEGRVAEVKTGRYSQDWIRLGRPGVGIGEHGISKLQPSTGQVRHSDKAMADYHYGKANQGQANPTTTAISARRVMIDLDLEFMMFFNRDSGPQGRHKVNDGAHPLAVAAVAHSLRPL